MPDALAGALALPGLWWLMVAIFVAGTVRGFSGFGTGLIYLPVAAQVLPPVWAITSLVICDLFGPAVIAHKAVRDANLPDLGRLFAGVLLGLPLGLAALYAVDPTVFRWGLSGLALVMLGCLVMGLRYTGTLTPAKVFGTGTLAGVAGGAAGLPGPPVILFYLASPLPGAAVRANTLLFLLGYDLLFMLAFAVTGRFEAVPLCLGLLLAVPNALGNYCGAQFFRPGYESVYRGVAYVIIAAAALTGLPVWDG